VSVQNSSKNSAVVQKSPGLSFSLKWLCCALSRLNWDIFFGFAFSKVRTYNRRIFETSTFNSHCTNSDMAVIIHVIWNCAIVQFILFVMHSSLWLRHFELSLHGIEIMSLPAYSVLYSMPQLTWLLRLIYTVAQTSIKDPLLSVSLFCHLASIILCALILSETTYLLIYLLFTWGSATDFTACKGSAATKSWKTLV